MLKKIISLMLALTVVLSVFAAFPAGVFAAADGTGNYRIATQNDPLRIRATASTDAKVVGSIPKGIVVKVTELSGSWGKVSYNGATGWILLDYATKTSDTEASNPTYATTEASKISARLDELRAKFPNGKYWNHYGSKTKNLDGWTDTPCPSGHYLNGVQQCNGQCDGFARKLALDLFGVSTYSDPWKKVSFSIDTLCVGDIFRYNGRHTVMVVGFTENTNQLIIADCNWDYHCKIRWDATFSISRYVSSVNWVLHYSGNDFTRAVYLNKPVTTTTAKTTTTPAPTTTTRPTVRAVDISRTECTLPVGTSVTLTAAPVPANIPGSDIVWSTSDGAVAKVDNGKVTGVAPGTATITATSGSVSASCKVTVSDKISIKRISGSDRIATAVEIAKQGWKAGATANVIIANGYSFPDALAGVPLSKALDAPILLTSGKSLEKSVADELAALGVKNVYILGGTAVVSGDVEKALTGKGLTVTRLAGDTRYETSVKIAEKIVSLRGKSETVYISNSNSFADALSAGPAAALEGCPILYTAANGVLDNATKEFIKTGKYVRARLIGGTAVIADAVKNDLKACGVTSTVRLAGSNRYETCLAAVKASEAKFTGKGISIATGEAFPDALAGGAFAAKQGVPLILAAPSPAPAMQEWLHAKNAANLYIFGGTAVVSDVTAYQYSA